MSYVFLPYGGKLFFNKDTLKINHINKIPLGLFDIEIQISIEPGKTNQNNLPTQNVYYLLKPDLVSILIDGKEILYSSNVFFTNIGTVPNNELKWGIPYTILQLKAKFKIDTVTIDFIESKRADDISFSLRFYIEVQPVSGNPGGSNPLFIIDYDKFPSNPWERVIAGSIEVKLSQKDWIKFLADMGYSEKLIIEIDRPKLEGFHETISHIEKAKDVLYNKSDPEDVIRDLRAARDSFKPFYDTYKDKIMELIDRGSIGQKPEHKNKSERIDDIYGKISYFLDIGPHSDRYKVTYRDALLAYREFVSILSYFSEMIEILRKEESEKIVKNEHPGHP
ncbi:MAG: hypothetical protein ACP5OE_09510 [Thermodesulfobium sp.]